MMKVDPDIVLFNKVKRGEEIICPMCGKSFIKAYSHGLYCSEKNCKYVVRFVFANERKVV